VKKSEISTHLPRQLLQIQTAQSFVSILKGIRCLKYEYFQKSFKYSMTFEKFLSGFSKILKLTPYSCFYSFIVMPAFPLRRVAGAAATRGLEVPRSFQQSLIVLLAPHQDGTNEVEI